MMTLLGDQAPRSELKMRAGLVDDASMWQTSVTRSIGLQIIVKCNKLYLSVSGCSVCKLESFACCCVYSVTVYIYPVCLVVLVT